MSESSPSPRAAFPLTAWLRRLSVPRLRDVLVARPDVARAPGPRHLDDLAERLGERQSVARALSRLPLRCFQAAEAIAALTALGDGVPRERLGGLLGHAGPGLDAALAELTRYALVWPDEAGLLHTCEPLRRNWQAPLGLGRGLADLLSEKTSDELLSILAHLDQPAQDGRHRRLAVLLRHHRDPDRVAALAASAPAAARELLDRYSREVPAERPPSSRPGLRWALDRGLLVRARFGYGPPQMPAEVALALRGPGWRAPFTPVPPVPATAPAAAEAVDREAAAAAYSFAGVAAAVLAACAAVPPGRLKGGGVGARELTRLGRTAGCEEEAARLVLGCAHAAGLLVRDGERFVVTAAYDDWTEQDPAPRTAALLRAWWTLPDTPSRGRDREGRVLPALGEGPPRNDRLAARRALLAAAAKLPAGQGVRRPEDLAAVVAWHRPMAAELDEDSPPFGTLLREAGRLGVLARGALSPLGAALRTGDAAVLEEAARRLLPAATERARIGGDLTAVVTGAPSARLERLLDAVAERESRGTASVWRFTAESIRRALDAGRTADAIRTGLAGVTDGPLPQPLTYLISDAARTHGRLKVVATPCVIHATEPALLTEVLHHRRLAGLGLRRLAPTVLVGRIPVGETLSALRAEGYAPVAAAADGTVRVERQERSRARPLPAPRRPAAGGGSPPDLERLAARLAADSTESERILAEKAGKLPLPQIRLLAGAIDGGGRVAIEYLGAGGERRPRTIRDIELDAPDLYAWCEQTGHREDFLISRIVGVRPCG
ncbi:helicase-associated domain-containing protein [Streptomyces litchfieldiae]|uniref:Helicase-associated domain-containing protein n=1 Tax=Streptomyces litchfieldiae TaxID=3075543 RepID=A0ABU2N1H1_9ACTN|nr:helicase-associated domain-containing protein [Streptomyces sp. DSM 44938]MDT0346599.1 helicase-associated domain-containing protein [Streptomyces sp. DSM 44938]